MKITIIAFLAITCFGVHNLQAADFEKTVQLTAGNFRKTFLPDEQGKVKTYLHIKNDAEPNISIRVVEKNRSFSETISGSDGYPVISCGEPFTIRGMKLLPVTIQPFFKENGISYLATEIEIDGRGLSEDIPPMSSAWLPVFKKLVLNFSEGRDYKQPHMLIICDDDFLPYMDEYIDWKRRRGIKVTLTALSDISPSPGSESIAGYVQNAYDTWSDPPDYLLLVGDEDHIPVYWLYASDPITIFSSESFPGWYTSDVMYGCVAGDDYFPDIQVGRLSASNVLEIRTILNKIISYERNPQIENPDFYTRAIVASDYLYPSQRQTKLQTREIMLSHEFTHVDTLFTYGQVNSMLQWINQGRSVINYRGAGWSDGWVMIDFYTYHIQYLQNFNLLPVVFGIGCGVGIITDNSPGFGEAWMTAGTPSMPKGAVGFVGPTWNTHTDFNNQLDLGIFRAIFQDSIYTLGNALLAGKMQMWLYFDSYISQDPNIEVILNQELAEYILLTDPSLAIRTVVPKTVHLSVSPDVAQLGSDNLTFTVIDEDSLPVPGAVCGVFSSEDSIWSGITDENGEVTIHTNVETMPAFLKASVFRHDLYPDTLSIQVVSNAQFLRLEGIDLEEVVGDTDHVLSPGEEVDLFVTIQNWGLSPTGGVTGRLSSADDKTQVLIDSCFIGHIGVMQAVESQNPFRIIVDGSLQNGDWVGFNLIMNDSLGYSWGAYFSLDVSTPVFQAVSVFPVDSSGGIFRGEQTEIGISLRNVGGADSDTITAFLRGQDTAIAIIQDSTSGMPLQHNQGEIISPFRIAIPENIWNRDTVPLILQLYSDQTTYSLNQELEINVTLDRRASDPGPDGENIYYCFDPSDTDFAQLPQFHWYEISPFSGGVGTAVPYPGQIIPTPFEFDYYGIPVREIPICHKGYISLFSLDVLLSEGYPLPRSNDGIRGMVAPFWMDLGDWNDQNYDVSYFHDPINGMLIIEWNNIPVFGNTDNRCTFELIIYDPAKHPTSDGNPIIEFIYKKFSGLLNPNYYGTVGIESIDEQLGITYKNGHDFASTSSELGDSTIIIFSTDISLRTPEGLIPGPPEIPASFKVNNPFPNPFNPLTTISFTIPRAGQVTFLVYDIKGRVVFINRESYGPGNHYWQWNGRNNSGESVSTGVYFLSVIFGKEKSTHKVLLMK